MGVGGGGVDIQTVRVGTREFSNTETNTCAIFFKAVFSVDTAQLQ